MKKILIVNLHSTRNAGDHALLLLALQQIYAHLPDVSVTLAANDPDSFVTAHEREEVVPSFFYWYGQSGGSGPLARVRQLVQIGRLTLLGLWAALCYRVIGRPLFWGIPQAQRSALQAYFDAAVVISCPGNFIYSRAYQSGLPILMPLFTIVYAWLAGKPIYMLPQTVGPLWRGWERRLLAWVLRRLRFVLVRDLSSLDLLAEMGFAPREVHLVLDLAFDLESAGEAQGKALLRHSGVDPAGERPLLGVTLIHWGAQNPAFRRQREYEEAVAAVVRAFVEEQNGTAVLFSQVCGPKVADDDRIPARRVRDRLAETDAGQHVVQIDDVLPPDLLKAAYGQMDLFLGSRLHSNIFAIGEGIPVVAIAYQDKTHGVMKMLGVGAYAVDIEAVDEENLLALYRTAWSQRAELQAQMQNSLARLRREAQATLDAVFTEIADVLETERP